MQKKLVVLAVAVAALPAAIAAAQSGDVVDATSAVTAGGAKKKPKPVTVKYLVNINGPEGRRANTATELDATWAGLRSNGKFFPTCTAAEIDAAQSDAGCDPGAVIGTGHVEAKIGPAADPTSPGALCKKDVKIYNEGQGKVNVFSSGNPADCLGIGYLPPVPGTVRVKGKNLVYALPIPDNIQQPLPGVSGYFSRIDVTFAKKTVKVKGKKRGYFESVGCGKAGTRAFSFTTVTPGGNTTAKNAAGKC